MHCTQCGSLVGTGVRFCSKCGSPISAADLAPAVPRGIAKKPSVIWLYLVGVLLIGAYAAVFIPAAAGEINSQADFGIFFLTALFFYLWWKRRGRKGWHGMLIGLGAGFVVEFVAGFISAFVRHRSGG